MLHGAQGKIHRLVVETGNVVIHPSPVRKTKPMPGRSLRSRLTRPAYDPVPIDARKETPSAAGIERQRIVLGQKQIGKDFGFCGVLCRRDLAPNDSRGGRQPCAQKQSHCNRHPAPARQQPQQGRPQKGWRPHRWRRLRLSRPRSFHPSCQKHHLLPVSARSPDHPTGGRLRPCPLPNI